MYSRSQSLEATQSLKDIVIEKGWTLSMLSERWGVSTRHVSKMLNHNNSLDLATYRLYYDAAKTLPRVTVNYLIEQNYKDESFTLLEKKTYENKYKQIPSVNSDLINNKDWEHFLMKFKEYTKNKYEFTVDINDNIFIPRHFYDHPFSVEAWEDLHAKWDMYSHDDNSDNNREVRGREVFEKISKRLKEANIIFKEPRGLTSDHKVFYGSDGFLISTDDLKEWPKSLVIKRILSDIQKESLFTGNN
jgi:hypothetical protein